MITEECPVTIEDNNQASFYEQEFAVEALQACAIDRGLDTGCDLEQIFPQLTAAKTLLEVGAGYGRALQHLQRLGYQCLCVRSLLICFFTFDLHTTI